ncbi:MAG: ZIP family metal transporter [Flavobacteriales bacterium]|nr:ZIP family metal transporter [Flavobacteriales bacterium]MBT7529395.1 ZIP family metal transporter [Flavobacteriaceae bacterium]
MYLYPFLAVIIVSIIVLFLSKKAIQINSKLTLAFSGAFLLSITVFELLPSVYFENMIDNKSDQRIIGLMIMIGILFQVILEFFSKGAEHGHIDTKKNKLPWVLLISLSIHAFVEGFSIRLDQNILYGIFIHKIPIAFIITTSLLSTKIKKYKILLFIFFFSIMTPLGTFISNNSDQLLKYSLIIDSLVAGVLLHVSTTILFETSQGHKFNLVKILLITGAIILAYFL